MKANNVLRNIRIEHSQGIGLALHRAAGTVSNVVVYDCASHGIDLINGTFDLHHAWQPLVEPDCG